MPELAKRSLDVWLGHLRVIESALDGNAHLCGEQFTAADILLGHALRMAADSRMIPEEFTATRAYFSRLEKRDAYRRMLEK